MGRVRPLLDVLPPGSVVCTKSPCGASVSDLSRARVLIDGRGDAEVMGTRPGTIPQDVPVGVGPDLVPASFIDEARARMVGAWSWLGDQIAGAWESVSELEVEDLSPDVPGARLAQTDDALMLAVILGGVAFAWWAIH